MLLFACVSPPREETRNGETHGVAIFASSINRNTRKYPCGEVEGCMALRSRCRLPIPPAATRTSPPSKPLLPSPRRNNSVVTVVDTVTPDIPLAGSRSSPPSFSGACSVPGSQAHRRRCSRGLQIWNLSSEFSQRVRKVAWRRTRLRSCRLGESPPSPASSRPTILE